MTTPPPTTVPESAALSVTSRISEFWTHQPRVWFIRTEATLAPQKLGDHSKFDLVVSKLNGDTVDQLSDFLMNPPETGRYEALKQKLLKIYEDSQTKQIEKLINEMELGDQKPSQLLAKMKALARDKVTDGTLKVLWQNLLPPTVRAVLTVTDTKDLDRLATIADDVNEVTKAGVVAAVAPQPSTSSSNEAEKTILNEIAKLSARFNELENRYRGYQPRSRDRYQAPITRNRSNSRRRRSEDDPDWVCFYHFRYADKAQKCVKPCAWKKTEN